MEQPNIDGILAQNQSLITGIIKTQNQNPFVPDIKALNKLYNNILTLTQIGDSLPDTPNMLFQHYIPISSSDQKKINSLERLQEAFAGEYFQLMIESAQKHQKPSPPKKSRQECRWTEEEESKFLEALEKLGESDLDEIAKHIGTRTKIQVRSHLQKHKLKIQNKKNKKQKVSDQIEKQ
ncbi:unnamed protein product [Blepharisma stoltei]|uniref:Uncharacterized protein n=1 Tax=Blepharisma stoltei TaxID=1481888 RepID=A0AAU9IW00_9CILI|nr:unnamed protein product [Blepharisma stoltei]